MTSELNPESGTTNYFWDQAPSGCGGSGWSTPGNLGAKQTNAGIYTCYGYDALNRVVGFEVRATTIALATPMTLQLLPLG